MWGLEVVESWHFETATEPASEPRSAGESSAAARSRCEPRPCLQEAKVMVVKRSEARAFLSTSLMYVCMLYGAWISHLYLYYAKISPQLGDKFTTNMVLSITSILMCNYPSHNTTKPLFGRPYLFVGYCITTVHWNVLLLDKKFTVIIE